MSSLRDLLPDAGAVLNLSASDLAGYILEMLFALGPVGKEHRGNFCTQQEQAFATPGRSDGKIGQRCAEAWQWLESNGMICERYDSTTGWFVITELGQRVASHHNLLAHVAASQLPEDSLHPEIIRVARPLFLQGRIDTAVFEAFKALEVEIRNTSGLGNDCIGIKLAQQAFHPDDGPLTDREAEKGERVALMNLMTGALGSYKNPHSHRRVALEMQEAREMIILASHLLNVVASIQTRANATGTKL